MKTLITIIAVIVGILMWSAHHDTQVQASAERYEKCVATKLHTTPSAWYNEHGEYPVCE